MRARRQQTAITIRSDQAAKRLAVLTRNGRSQAEVIEEALEKLPTPINDGEDREAFLKEFDALARQAAAAPRRWKTMAEFDEATYDERGLLK
jgi:antitoxin VapB